MDQPANQPCLSPHAGLRCAAWALAAVLLAVFCVESAHAARLALVIGNDHYQNIKTLKNARNDARLIASTLQAAGFEVVGGVRENLREKDAWRAVDQFAARIQPGDEVAFYFSGHGVQLRDTVLLPVDIVSEGAAQVERDGMALGIIQDKLAHARFSLLIIDACRDNPFAPRFGTRSLGETRGLQPPTVVARGSAVLMAAGRGQKALDMVPGGTAANGLFTHELNALLRTPGLGVIAAARKVRDQVEAKALTVGHEQRPTLVDDVSGDYVLFALPAPHVSTGGAATGTPATAPLAAAAPPAPAPAPVRPAAAGPLSQDTHGSTRPTGVGRSSEIDDYLFRGKAKP